MLLGLALICGGTIPVKIVETLLFCFFTLAHLNQYIASGYIVTEQARLRSEAALWERRFADTSDGRLEVTTQFCFVSVQYWYTRANYGPWVDSLIISGLLGALETFFTVILWIIPIIADRIPLHGRLHREAAKHPLLLRAISVAIIARGFRDRLPTEWPWIS